MLVGLQVRPVQSDQGVVSAYLVVVNLARVPQNFQLRLLNNHARGHWDYSNCHALSFALAFNQVDCLLLNAANRWHNCWEGLVLFDIETDWRKRRSRRLWVDELSYEQVWDSEPFVLRVELVLLKRKSECQWSLRSTCVGIDRIGEINVCGACICFVEVHLLHHVVV